MQTDTLIVIPARYQSSRLPGKPLLVLAGQSMLERVWKIAKSVSAADVCIATDDDRIAEHANSFGAQVIMTSAECRNGSERVAEAMRHYGEEKKIIVNFQGDSPLLPPLVLEKLIRRMREDGQAEMATPAYQLSASEYEEMKIIKAKGSSSGTFVTFDKKLNALYFSSALIPFLRGTASNLEQPPVYRHIGVYAYRRDTLERYVQLSPGKFEKIEELEQLRALEEGIPIQVVLVDLEGRCLASVDNPDDVHSVEDIIARQGELLS